MNIYAIVLNIFILFNALLLGQHTQASVPHDILALLNESGKDNSPVLNISEGTLFNRAFKEKKDTFDFIGKRVAFFKGNIGSVIITKVEYFNRTKYIAELVNSESPHSITLLECINADCLYILNEEDAKKTGYDAVIVDSMTKIVLQTKEVVKNLMTERRKEEKRNRRKK